MHTKTRILHHIALNPGKTTREVANALAVNPKTARTYIYELNKDKKITSMGHHQWRLCIHISVESLNIPPEVINPKKPWEFTHEAIMNMMRTHSVPQ
jgi:hypothetical protein